MSGKLFIKTHGCQMNEYDSTKMADVLAASHGLTLTDNEAEADVILINTCSIREKAQEKVFSQLGRWRKLKQKNEAVIIGVGGWVASEEGDTIIARARHRALLVGPQTPHPPEPAGRHPLPGEREVRPPAAATQGRTERVRVNHGRLLEVLCVLRRPVHTR